MQRLNTFAEKWGNFIWCMLGLLIITGTIILQVRGVEYGYLYDGKRRMFSKEPVEILYFVGGMIILLMFKKKWPGDVKRWMKAKRKARLRK